MEIYLIRHGLTEWNKERRLQGNSDIPLAKEGIDKAIEEAEKIKDIHFDLIYSSPLLRALETAKIFRGERDINIITDDRLREINFGVCEGKLFDELKKDENYPLQYFFDDPEKYYAPEGGESLEDACKRAASFWKEVILPLEGKAERIMIVAHGAINQAQMCFIKNRTTAGYWEGGLQNNCEATIIRYSNGSFC